MYHFFDVKYLTVYTFNEKYYFIYAKILIYVGWVVGSLDLLGNPAGFARAVGAGVTDFVYLPYKGLLSGPRAFVSGLSTGALSLFTQISSGKPFHCLIYQNKLCKFFQVFKFIKIQKDISQNLSVSSFKKNNHE